VKKSYEVSILNQKITIKSDADERYIQKVADYVNKKIYDIVNHTKSVSTLNVAILTALNLADDLFKLNDMKKEKNLLFEKKIKNILSLIEEKI